MENINRTPRLTRSQSRLIQNTQLDTKLKNDRNNANFNQLDNGSRVLLEKIDFNNMNFDKSVDNITEKLENVSFKTPRKSRAHSIRIKNPTETAKMSIKLIGRTTEKNQLTEFLTTNIINHSNSNIYISGFPGTGKTFVVTEVMKNLVQKKLCEYHFINCMDLSNANLIYREMLSQLTGTLLTNYQKAVNELEIYLKSRSQNSLALVFVLDEIDQLINRDKLILNRIFKLVEITPSRLIIVGIANSLDLVERMLPNLTLQSCRPHCMNFQPYNEQEINAILLSQITDKPDPKQLIAVKYCSKKISTSSGDARAALDLYKRAVEFSELEELQALRSESVDRLPSTVECTESPIRRVLSTPQFLALKMSMKSNVSSPSIKHVNRALYEVQKGQDPYKNIINETSGKSTLPLHQKLALCAGLILTRRQQSSRMKQIKISQLYEMYLEICQSQEIEKIDMSNFIDITGHLESRGIVRIQPHKETRQRIFIMNLDRQGIEKALDDGMLLTSIMHKFLPVDDF